MVAIKTRQTARAWDTCSSNTHHKPGYANCSQLQGKGCGIVGQIVAQRKGVLASVPTQ